MLCGTQGLRPRRGGNEQRGEKTENNRSWIGVPIVAALAIALFPAVGRLHRQLPRRSPQHQPGLRHRRPGGDEPPADRKGKTIAHQAGRVASAALSSAGFPPARAIGCARPMALARARVGVMTTDPRREPVDLQPDPARRRLRLPDDAGRDQARDRRTPPGPGRPGPYPTLVEYSGYGYANPGGPQSAIQPIAQPPRLRGRRREHARHRLLGRRLRLLRAAAERSTATTWSRPSPASPGCSTARSG